MAPKRQPSRSKLNPATKAAAAKRPRISVTPAGAGRRKRYSLFRNVLKVLGPGLVTGAADDDPSGIATYSSIGAQYGYSML